MIKVESPDGDATAAVSDEPDGPRAPFLSLNRNKRSIALDLKTEQVAKCSGACSDGQTC